MLGMATSPPVLYHRRLVHPIIRHTLYYTHAGKAGAIVYTPRERDWQRNEVIVDNDTHPQGCIYQEIKSRKGKWKTAPTPHSAQKRLVYRDGTKSF